jgi:hypothetical protein
MFTRWDVVSVTSNTIDTTVPAAELSMWVRRGSDAFSEDPEAGNEDLVVEYRNNVGTWIQLENFPGGGTPGEIITRTYSLPSTALHASFQVRFRQTGGDGVDWDYYHVDDVVVTEVAPPVPGAGFCDDFESGLTRWTVSNATRAGIGSYTSNSPSNSLYTRHGVVTVTSDMVDMSGPAGKVSLWLRRGADSFSENPESGENLVVEYWNNVGSWVALETFAGNGTAGQIYTRNYNLPADALHNQFQLRFRQTGGSGVDWDYWHMDDVCIQPSQQLVYYAMDEDQWIGSGDVTDSSGQGNDGTAVGGGVTTNGTSPAITGSPGTCRYGEFPINTDVNIRQAVDSGLDVNSIGDTGTISFWYKSNERWNGNRGDRMLFDASTTADGQKYFFFMLQNNSRLRFGFEDSSDGDFTLDSGNNNFNAGVWVHVAVTWDLPNDSMEIYINGSLDNSSSPATNGVLGDLDTLYFGDNRSTYLASGASGNSANGSIDEARIYNYVQTQAQVAADMNATHACVNLDHYAITDDGTGTGITCVAKQITITGHDSGDNAVAPSSGTVLNLATSPAGGYWASVAAGSGTLDSGASTYTWPGGETSVTLNLNYTNPGSDPENVDINVSDGTATETEDLAVAFSLAGFIVVETSETPTSINTQIAGKDSNVAPNAQALYLQAVRASDNDASVCAPVFQNQSVSVDLGAECSNPTTCAGRQLSVNATPIATSNDNGSTGAAAYTNFPTLAFDNESKAAIVLNYADAGQLILHARHNILNDDGSVSGNYMVGSSGFVVRPFGFAFTDIRNPGANAAYDDGDDVLNPGGTAAAGSGFIAAEDVFRVSVIAYQYDAADDTDIDGVPDVGADITDNGNGDTPNFAWDTTLSAYALGSFTPAGGTAGNVTGPDLVIDLADFSSGSGTSAGDLRYDQVGSVTLQVLASDYITPGIDVYGYSLSVGRFFPDHFTLTAGSITAGCGTFTYMDQPSLGIDYTLQARSLLDSPTTNYDQAAGYNTRNSSNGDTISLHAENNNDGTNMALRLSTPALVDFAGGSKTVSTIESFSRAATPDGPYQNLQLSIQMSDEQDSRNITSLDEKPSDNNNCVMDTDCTTKAIGAITDVRYGRLVLDNAYGSELLSLIMPLHTEYFNGSGFITNTVDSCTTYNSTDVTPDHTPYPGDGLDPGETNPAGAGTLVNGIYDPGNPLTMTAPGLNNDGSVDISLDVGAWLEYDWNGTGDEDPKATATFGIFGGSNSTIYIREVY